MPLDIDSYHLGQREDHFLLEEFQSNQYGSINRAICLIGVLCAISLQSKIGCQTESKGYKSLFRAGWMQCCLMLRVQERAERVQTPP